MFAGKPPFVFSVLRFRLCAGLLCYMVIALSTGEAHGAEKEVVFQSQNRELSPSEVQGLNQWISDIKAMPSTRLVIEESTAELKPSSKAFIDAKVRALRIFEFLLSQGIDPALIQFEATSTRSGRFLIKVLPSKGTASTQLITPLAQDDQAPTMKEFSLKFGSAAAEPLELSEEAFSAFLKTVGQPGNDALVIEGYADGTGQAEYNKALSEFRALRVYELLVRRGLPPYRIKTKGMGAPKVMSKALSEAEKAAARRVVIRWTTDEEVAAVAQVEDKKIEQAATIEAPEAPSPQKAQLQGEDEAVKAQDDKREASVTSRFDLLALAGVLAPSGDLRDYVKSSPFYGLGVGSSVMSFSGSEIRVALSLSGPVSLDAKQDDRSGSLDIQIFQIGADYRYQSGTFNPYFGLGLAAYNWEGKIEQNSSARQNSGSKNDLGIQIKGGLDFAVSKSFTLGPEVTWHRVGGDFSEDLLSATLIARWGI